MLKPVTGSVSGTISVGASSGAPTGGAAGAVGVGRGGLNIALSDGTITRTTQTATQPAGAYQFAGVTPGTYMMRVSGAGITDYVVMVEVHAGEDVLRDVAIP